MDMLEDLRKTIEKLIARYEAAKAENASLRSELRASKLSNDTYRKQVEDLLSEIETRKLTEAFSAGANSPEAKKKIDTLIAEISRCISLLEN